MKATNQCGYPQCSETAPSWWNYFYIPEFINYSKAQEPAKKKTKPTNPKNPLETYSYSQLSETACVG